MRRECCVCGMRECQCLQLRVCACCMIRVCCVIHFPALFPLQNAERARGTNVQAAVRRHALHCNGQHGLQQVGTQLKYSQAQTANNQQPTSNHKPQTAKHTTASFKQQTTNRKT